MRFSQIWRLAAVLIVAAAATFILNLPTFNAAIKNAAFALLNPVQKIFWAAGADLHNFADPLLKANSLASENERLHQQVDDLLVKTEAIGELKKENDSLRQGLNLELDKDFDLKLADIVGKNTANDIIAINIGSKDMVRAGMPVITGQKALVGKVTKVYDNFSEVTLVTNKDFSFDVKVGDTDIDGLIKGRGGYCAAIDLIPKDKNLENGQAVFTGALGGIFPQGLLVGTISEVRKNDVQTFQSAQIAPAFDAAAARQVFVAVGKYPLGMECAAPDGLNKK